MSIDQVDVRVHVHTCKCFLVYVVGGRALPFCMQFLQCMFHTLGLGGCSYSLRGSFLGGEIDYTGHSQTLVVILSDLALATQTVSGMGHVM